MSLPGESGSGLDVRAMIEIKRERDELHRQLTAANARIDLLEASIAAIRATANAAIGPAPAPEAP